MAQCLVDKALHECNSEEGMATQIVNLVTGVVKLILPVLDCVVHRESDIFETAKVLFSDKVIEETKCISSVMEVVVTEPSQTHQDIKYQ